VPNSLSLSKRNSKFCIGYFFGEHVGTTMYTNYSFNGPLQRCHELKKKNVMGCSLLWLHHKIETKIIMFNIQGLWQVDKGIHIHEPTTKYLSKSKCLDFYRAFGLK